jgi:Salmonella virulence plasmid 65kDa B protein
MASSLSTGDQDKASDQSFQVAAPSLAAPKGGGALRGIGEKFSVNPLTDTGSLMAPIFTSPGRSEFFPKLSLSYDSGAASDLELKGFQPRPTKRS